MIALVLALALSGGSVQAAETPFRTLAPGMEFAEIPAPVKAPLGDSIVRVLRLDMHTNDLVLINASATDGRALPPGEWAARHGLLAVINASMYQQDRRTSISLMRNGAHTNNGHLTKDQTILAFGAKAQGLAPVQIIDRECDDFAKIAAGYQALVQNIRMLSCKGANVWAPSRKIASQAAVGLDKNGRLLFVHSRAPYSTHDFIEILRKMPLALNRALYVEGGPPAQLYIKTQTFEKSFIGSYSAGSNENDNNAVAFNLPNVLGIKAKSP